MARDLRYDALWATLGRRGAFLFLVFNQETHTKQVVFWFNNECERLYRAMASKKGSRGSGSSSSNNGGWKGYCNVELSAFDKEQLRQGVLDGEAMLEIVTASLATGHKVGLSLNSETGTVSATITGVRDDCPNKGIALTGYGSSVLSALTSVAYKFDVILKGRMTVQARDDVSDFG